MTTTREAAGSTTETGPVVASASDLCVDIAGVPVLRNVSFEVREGECLGLVGESGSGKTVTSRALVGSLGRIGGRVVSGALTIVGRDVTEASDRTWRDLRGSTVALIPQASIAGLDPVMRVGAQLRETVTLHTSGRGAKAESLSLLERVRIAEPHKVYRSYPHELSGGMRQRVMIALALAGKPRFLVADEPTTALDVTIQRDILQLLDTIRRETGVAIIFISHDLSVVRSIADTICVMYAGATVEIGRADTVLDAPLHPYSRALRDADPAAVARGLPLRSISGAPPQPGLWPGGCRFAPRCEHAIAACAASVPRLEPAGEGLVACLRWKELSHEQR